VTLQTRDIWARELGLAASPLFGREQCETAHTAMLDGVAGSFVFSDATSDGFHGAAREKGADWSWSSMMRNHVLIDNHTVTVASAQGGSAQPVDRSSVERDLERFLAYLESTSSGSADVIDHIIGSFQGLRAERPGASETQLASFLALLALRLENAEEDMSALPDLVAHLPEVAEKYDLPVDGIDSVQADQDLLRRFYEQLLSDKRNGRELRVDLTVRHAGSELFQAAQLVPPPPQQQGLLFGMPSVRIAVRPHSLKGVAYTPIGLARVIAEQTIGSYLRADMTKLVVADYACGSGSFLTEAIAALGRAEWAGELLVVGYDTSPTAIITTRFAISCAKRDYPNLKVKSDIRQQNFLDPNQPVQAADIVLMNPPYRAWADMDKKTRANVMTALGSNYRNRPDLSMVFLDRAVTCAKPGAMITSLLPAGVIAGESASPWRRHLAERAAPRLIAVLGDHSLFRFATVNVAAVMLERDASADEPSDPGTRMIWASEVPGAASAALRQLRRSPVVQTSLSGRANRPWSIYALSTSELLDRATWLPSPGLLPAQAAERLRTIGSRIEDLFDVKTGIRAGDRSALVLSRADWEKLDPNERHGFRPVAEKQAIAEGTIQPNSFFFEAGLQIETEEQLRGAFPQYFEHHLGPAKAVLAARNRAGSRWWLPSEARNSWRLKTDPRIISRQWFRNDGFAVDPTGTFSVVQGYAWFPTKRLRLAAGAETSRDTLVDVLRLYCVLFSSDVFFKVVREYSTNAAGGQLSLQQNLIRKIPLPLLPDVIRITPGLGDTIYQWGRDFPPLPERNVFAARCYGFNPEAFA
jgi:adenine-specific DNA-methyltransferase